MEIKSGNGARPEVIRQLATGMRVIDASAAWIIDRDKGEEPLAPSIRRRGLPLHVDWLPR